MINSKYLIILFCFSIIYTSDSLSVKSDLEDSKDFVLFPFLGHVPAIGQLHNDKPLKAMILMTMQSYWTNEYISSRNEGDISDRNRSLWWMIILLIYGSIDAYIDANIKEFPYDEEIENTQKNMKLEE